MKEIYHSFSSLSVYKYHRSITTLVFKYIIKFPSAQIFQQYTRYYKNNCYYEGEFTEHNSTSDIFFLDRSYHFKITFKQHDLTKRHYLKLMVCRSRWNSAMWYKRGNFTQFFFLKTKIKIPRNIYP